MSYKNSKRAATRLRQTKDDRSKINTIETVYPQGVTTRIELSYDEIAIKSMSKAEIATTTLHPTYFVVLDGRRLRVSSTTFETVSRTLMSQAMTFSSPTKSDVMFGRGTERPLVIVNGVLPSARKGGVRHG